jgi:hypothetical protein
MRRTGCLARPLRAATAAAFNPNGYFMSQQHWSYVFLVNLQ